MRYSEKAAGKYLREFDRVMRGVDKVRAKASRIVKAPSVDDIKGFGEIHPRMRPTRQSAKEGGGFKRPTKRNTTTLEYFEQVAVADWLRAKKILFIHVPNGSMAPVPYRVKLKRLGLSGGFPDLLIFDPPLDTMGRSWPVGGPKGVALEMKRVKGGKTSPKQMAWGHDLTVLGWSWIVAKGSSEAIKALEKLGY